MRGQVQALFPPRFVQGITPADAGTRETEWTAAGLMQDHPRGCGDKSK